VISEEGSMMATAARPRIRPNRPQKAAAPSSAESSARKIVAILEDQMAEMGLTEEEKNRKTAELAAFVKDAVSSHAKQHKPRRSARLRA
jgi:hypothetical protein